MTDFKAKMHQMRFRLGVRPRPRWGSLQRSPDPLAGFGAASRQGRGWAREEEEKGRGRGERGKWRGGKGRPQVTVEPGPLSALLRHCQYYFALDSTFLRPS